MKKRKIPKKKVAKRKIVRKTNVPKRRDWEANDTQLQDAYWKLVQSGSRPSARLLAETTGIHETTVNRHLSEWDFTKELREHRPAMKEVLTNLARKASGSKADAQIFKLFLQAIGNWQEKTAVQGANVQIAPTQIKIEIIEPSKKVRTVTDEKITEINLEEEDT